MQTYLKNKSLFGQMTKQEIEKEKRSALHEALQYYRILSYKTFYSLVFTVILFIFFRIFVLIIKTNN